MPAVSLRVGTLLAIAGGFLDAHTFVYRNGVFSTAQTGNLVLCGVEAARGHWRQVLRHTLPVLSFVAGVALADSLKRSRAAAMNSRLLPRAALVLQILTLLGIGGLPTGVSDLAVTAVISLVASVQVSIFRTLIDWPYNATFMTGNIRSASQTLYLGRAQRDEKEGRKALAFWTIIFAFLGGSLFGGQLTMRLHAHAIWAAAGVLGLGLLLFNIDEQRYQAART